jgi:hypothetical protein
MLRTYLSGCLLLGVFVAPSAVRACPLCRDAVTKTSDAQENDQLREAAAYNNSIYLMVGMPYLMVGGLGIAVYRHLRQRARLDAAFIAQLEGGSAPCHPSPDEDSSPGR